MFQDTFKRILEFGNRMIEVIIQTGEKFGKRRSGETLGSLTKETKFTGESEVELNVWGSKVFQYIEEGRPAGAKMPPQGALESWMDSVGIPEEKEFAVRRSIAQKGIAPTPLLETAFIEITRDFQNYLPSIIGVDLGRELTKAAKRGFVFPDTRI